MMRASRGTRGSQALGELRSFGVTCRRKGKVMQLDSFRTLGRSGLRVSPLTLGTMVFDDTSWGADEQTSVGIIDRYLTAGGNALDTAYAYADGRSEKVIGGYLARHPGPPDRLVIATQIARHPLPRDPNR